MLKFSKNNDKGITMIALTITVIVLLILASITLAQLTDDNSVVKKAQESKNETESAQKYENETTSNILATIPSTDNGKKDNEVHICVRGSGIITTSPTCTNKGIRSYKCTVCDKVLETEEVPANGHSPNKTGVANPDATCTETGEMCFYCDNCSEILAKEIIPAKGHKFTTYISNNDATCTTDGTKTATCDNCGKAKQTITDTGSKLGHNYQETAREEATCDKDGYLEYTCSRCGDKYTDTVTKLGHNYQETEREEATSCQANGYVIYKCDICNAWYEEILYGSHDEVINEWIDPTAEQKGRYTTICSKCNTELDSVTIEYKPHTLVETGSTHFENPVVKCEVCNFTCTHSGTVKKMQEGSYRCTNCYYIWTLNN